MRTVVLGERPPQLQALLEQRRALGLDVYDEVWDGEYHMSPAGSDEHAEVQARLIEILGPRARAAGLRGDWAGEHRRRPAELPRAGRRATRRCPRASCSV